jgi:RNA polymerase sigma-70 factor (ECF subfamily)
MAVDPDAPLVGALRLDDREAMDRLVERYRARVYRLAFGIVGVREEAEEVVQDALWSAIRKIHTFREESSLGSWIYRIAANAAYHKLRVRRRRAREIALDEVWPTTDDDRRPLGTPEDWSDRVEERALQGELRRVLAGAIEALPPDHRTALVLHDVEGLSNPDIAASLRISLPAVKSRVRRSRLAVRRRLSAYFGSIGTSRS